MLLHNIFTTLDYFVVLIAISEKVKLQKMEPEN